MKTNGFLKRDHFGLGILAQLFNRPQNRKKSESLEDLKQEITSSDYSKKIKFLIRQELLLRYSPETVEQGLEDLDFKIIAKHVPQPFVVKEEEPVVQKQPTSVVRINEILTEEKQQEVWKVERRIPKWFKKPYQYNTQILLAFMELLGDGKSVSYFDLQSACHGIKTFEGNYNQMKNFGISNHAKVFEEAGSRITLWEPVREFVKKEYIKSRIK